MQRDYYAPKKEYCIAFLNEICDNLAEGLPTGFKLELHQEVSKFINYL